MANTFNNGKLANFGTTEAAVYTTPAGTTAVIHAFYISNKLVSDITVTVKVGSLILLNQVTVKAKSTLVFNKPINLKATEDLRILSNVNNAGDAFVSVLEIV